MKRLNVKQYIRFNTIPVMTKSVKNSILLLCGLLLFLFGKAQNYTVNTTVDGNSSIGTVNLRGAIVAASSAGGAHTITIPPGTYTLTLGQITLGNNAQNLTISGTDANSTIISQTTATRIFIINTSGNVADVTTTISGIKFQNGNLNSDNLGGGAILCGGPNNVTNVNDCIFSNNTIDPSRTNGRGGAIRSNGGGTLAINQCTFINNFCPAPTNASNSNYGGAVAFELATTSGARNCNLSITNCVFNGNSVGGVNAGGGALYINAQLQSTTTPNSFQVNVAENTFVNNTATGSSSAGGAIYANNYFSNGNNTFQLHYNRFVGNNAATGSALGMQDSPASVDATNNWWGCNAGPSGCSDNATRRSGSQAGILNTSPYLRLSISSGNNSLCNASATTLTASFVNNSLGNNIDASNLSAFSGLPISFTGTLGALTNAQTTIQSNGSATLTYTAGSTAGTGTVNAIVDNIPGNDDIAKTSITVNVAPSLSQNPANISICFGSTASFSATASGSGTLFYQWYKGTMALSDGTTSNGSNITGATTGTLTFTNAGTVDAGTNYSVRVSSSTGCTPAVSSVATLAVSSPTTPTATTSNTRNINANNTVITNTNCSIITTVVPSGSAPVAGNVTATVTVQNGVQVSTNGSPYVPRYYDINPATNAGSATATLTLYFTQAEFTAFNAYPGHGLNLPVDAADAANYKANVRVYIYHGTNPNFTSTEEINPADNNIIWNSTYSRWEITFNVIGFSRLYVASAGSTILPLQGITFGGHIEGNTRSLNWKTEGANNLNRFEIERSQDGIHFSTIGQVTAGGNYQFTDISYTAKDAYYRLKIIDNDGHYSYSSILALNLRKETTNILVFPNPFLDNLFINIDCQRVEHVDFILTDLTGKVIVSRTFQLQIGRNALTINGLEMLAKGSYIVQVKKEGYSKTVKIVKAE